MTLRLAMPWQWAENDSKYYDKARALLGNPFFYNYKFDLADGNPSTRYNPMLFECKTGPLFDKALAKAKEFPRRMWFLGNEPERTKPATGSQTDPVEFAKAAKIWAENTAGKSFMVLPGILWNDEGRYWINQYLAAKDRVIPGVWSIHIYGSTTPAEWEDQYSHAIRFFRKKNINSVVWVTETNCLSKEYADSSKLMAYLNNRHGTFMWWFASRDPFIASANDLHDQNLGITKLGSLFKSLQAS